MSEIVETEIEEEAVEVKPEKRLTHGQLILRRFLRNRSAVIGLIGLLILIAVAIIGPFVYHWSYLDVDGEAPVGTLLHVGGQLRGLWQVANVTDRGGHMVVGAQVALNRLSFRGGLHDHQLGRCHCLSLPLLPRICSTLCWSSDGERRRSTTG